MESVLWGACASKQSDSNLIFFPDFCYFPEFNILVLIEKIWINE